ncbi:MAG: SDR family oxidoreductase [Spirochaetes bacterium]|nr:SDR family oxidoreductase [Spirochaetota bacterium]MBX3720218.1 SDR family oxidoreductase [Turneriella sp.]
MHVFITGAATGIGEATIDRWLEKDPAASFTIADKNETALAAVCKKLAARGVKAHGIAADITQLDKIPVIIKEAREKLGPIDILINNAGIMIVEDFSQMSWETGKRMLDINLTAPLRLIYEVLPEMIARKSGGIINIASMAGKALLPGCTWYGASKAGIGHASEILYGEVKDHGIHVLTVYPGPIATDLEKGARQGYEENWVTQMMPVGDRYKLAEKIVAAYFKQETVLAYPEIYDTARHFHSLAGWFVRIFAPKTRAA